jgi:hypothetical protein
MDKLYVVIRSFSGISRYVEEGTVLKLNKTDNYLYDVRGNKVTGEDSTISKDNVRILRK